MLSKRIMERCGALGVNILNNCNEVAGQSVMHFHLHIIPRYDHEEFVIAPKENNNKFDLKEIQEQIKNGLVKR